MVEVGGSGSGERRLIEELWPEDPPTNPAKALQVVVARARQTVGPRTIERTATGYRLALEPTEVDVWAARPEGLRLAAQGNYVDALPLLEQAGDDDEVVEARLRSVAAVAGVPHALEAFEAYREDLADRLGIDPSPALRSLHTELLARDRPVHTGLRFDADALVGREADVVSVGALVRSSRLVSVIGAGGLGKTRLAHVVGRGADQPIVHFVELASVATAEGVVLEVADALGVRDNVAARNRIRHEDALGRIVDAVGTAPSLLILDNCEHVVDAVADLVSALLARTPNLHVLTTSRAPLGLAAERIYQLPELDRTDAVELFVDRATSARAGVRLDDAEVGSLVDRLDGLPLAIELAAAKVRVMSVPEIERRLENRFALLRGGSRDAPERHQTLLAVIDWSWNLLAEPDRVALRRLSVFRDGFGLDAALAVIGEGAVDSLEALTDQSLVSITGGAVTRYRLLETVREFGQMQLIDAGDDLEAHRRLRSWAMDVVDRESALLFSPDQVAAVRRVRAEENNLLDVLRAALADDDVTTTALVFACLSGFWTVEGSHLKVVSQAAAVESVLLGHPVPAGLESAYRLVLSSIATNRIIFSQDSISAAMAALRDLGTDDPDPRLRAMVHVLLAIADGDADLVEGLQGLAADPTSGVARYAASWISFVLENYGDIEGSRAAAARALAMDDGSEGPWSRSQMAAQLAGLSIHSGDTAAARAYAELALPDLAELGVWDDLAQTQALLALVEIRDGNLAEARRRLDQIGLAEGSQSIFGGLLGQLAGHAELLIAEGQVEEGLRAYRDAAATLRARSVPGGLAGGDDVPWVMAPEAGSLVAHCRAGRAVEMRASRDGLRDRVGKLLGDASDSFIDYPVAGCSLFALAVWEFTAGGDPDAGRALLRCARDFAFSQMFPSMDLAWAVALAGEDDYVSRPARSVRAEAHALVAGLN